MSPEEARRLYAGPKGEHTAFEAELEALCDKYQVQAVTFYAGFDRVVSRGHVASRRQLCLILRRAWDLIPEMMEGAATVLANGPRFWVRSRGEPPRA